MTMDSTTPGAASGNKPVLVVVIGGGVSGLTVTYELIERSQRMEQPVEVLCLEAGERPGGNIWSERTNDFLCESGPNGFLDNAPCTLTLANRLGISDRLIRARAEAEIRYIFREPKLRQVPSGPSSFMTSDVISILGRLRLICEPFIPKTRNPDADESIHAFAQRRMGKEAAEILIGSMVGGIYGGDARELSLAATFPKMCVMEQEHGSLVRAMIRKRKEGGGGGPAGPGGKLTSFQNGMQELIHALAGALGDRLRPRTPVLKISDMGQRGFRVLRDSGAPLDADAVVLACPSWKSAELVKEFDPDLGGAMEAIPSAPLAVVHLGFSKDALGDQLNGFGYLSPRGQGLRSLGTIWTSSLFENRAPDGRCLLTTMVGGATYPEATELTDSELVSLVRDDLEKSMAIKAEPYFTRIFRHPRGIPQYTLGHMERLKTIDERLAHHSRLWVSGNSYRGISINACIEEAPRIAEEVLDDAVLRSMEATP